MADVSAASLPETCPLRSSPTVWIWLGHSVYLGPALGLDPHSTAVQCLAVGVDAPFTVNAEGLGTVTTRSALVPARTTHHITATDGRMLFCYFDPGSTRSAVCRSRMSTVIGGFGFDHCGEHELLELCNEGGADPDRLLDASSGPGDCPIDPRIKAAVEAIRARPADLLSAAEFADRANLSTTYFLRLFAAQAGTSFRRYRLWSRMLHAWSAVSKGSDLTSAATEAGFASPSHFSETFHRMFGLTPSAVIGAGVEMVIADETFPEP